MGRYYWFRVAVMIVSFVGSVYAISRFDQSPEAEDRTRNHNSTFLKWLGFQSDNMVNLCPTRIQAMISPDGKGIKQEGMTWYRKDKDILQELDQVAIEKWFASHCIVKAEKVEATEKGSPLFVVAFISGNPEILLRSAEGLYTWMGKTFRSTQLDDALKVLEDVPIRLRPSRQQ